MSEGLHGKRAIALNRAELQQLATDRVRDAEALLSADRWSGAYYLAGYAVECGLKSCILALIERTGIVFRDKRFAEKCWTHDIEGLVKAADLEMTLGLDISANVDLGSHWLILKDWSATSRYMQKTEEQARQLFLAVTDPANGVLAWISSRW